MPPINPLAYLSQFTGFSPDGLSYSVADDAGKMFGEALAQDQARAAQPRTNVYGEPLREDQPQALRSELLAPIISRFGLDALARPTGAGAKAETYHVGNSLLQRNPLTGTFDPVYTAPPKPPTVPQFAVPTAFDLLHKPVANTKATAEQWQQWNQAGLIPPDLATNFPLNAILAPKAAAAATNAPAAAPSFMRMGDTNSPATMFNNAVKAGMNVVNPSEGVTNRQVGRFIIKGPPKK